MAAEIKTLKFSQGASVTQPDASLPVAVGTPTADTHAVTRGYLGGAGAKCNFAATLDPTVNDDSGDGYGVGSRWINTSSSPRRHFVLMDSTLGAAVWVPVTSKKAGNSDLTLTASDTIALNNLYDDQDWLVQGNAGAITLSSTPFAAVVPLDGAVVTLIGNHDTNTVTVLHNDASKGCLLNGDCELARGNTLQLKYISALDRYVEISRSN
jgi:hypothetical protein